MPAKIDKVRRECPLQLIVTPKTGKYEKKVNHECAVGLKVKSSDLLECGDVENKL